MESEKDKLRRVSDALCSVGLILENLSGLCAVLRMGFYSSDFGDGRDAAACMWIMEEILDQSRKIYVADVLKNLEEL